MSNWAGGGRELALHGPRGGDQDQWRQGVDYAHRRSVGLENDGQVLAAMEFIVLQYTRQEGEGNIP
ncbi:MAG: hypothetical protein OXN89_07230 [Bryobacterales bacterium]|nr:hypothetical protein [Bryobacterales bacterium]